MIEAKKLARKCRKIICMTDTLRRAKLVRDWRTGCGLSTADLAAQITKLSGPKVRRQNIEQFEAGDIDRPRYLPELARVMGYASVDQLIRCEPPPKAGQESELSPEALALARSFDRIPKGQIEQMALAMCKTAIEQAIAASQAVSTPLGESIPATGTNGR